MIDKSQLTDLAKIRDQDGGETEYPALGTVANVAPTASAGGDVNLLAGQLLARAGSITDPGADSWSAVVHHGDGAGFVPLILGSDKTFSLAHLCPANGASTAVVHVTNDDGGMGSTQFQVLVGPPPEATPSRVVSFKTTKKGGALSAIFVGFLTP
jgi:hypothetical protein